MCRRHYTSPTRRASWPQQSRGRSVTPSARQTRPHHSRLPRARPAAPVGLPHRQMPRMAARCPLPAMQRAEQGRPQRQCLARAPLTVAATAIVAVTAIVEVTVTVTVTQAATRDGTYRRHGSYGRHDGGDDQLVGGQHKKVSELTATSTTVRVRLSSACTDTRPSPSPAPASRRCGSTPATFARATPTQPSAPSNTRTTAVSQGDHGRPPCPTAAA